MRRQTLRFPVGQQFKKILEDDHEWIVLTDLHLKPLVMDRCNLDEITSRQRENAYMKLYKKTNFNEPTRIYDLHSHPAWEGVIDQLAPSQGDMTNFTFERATQRFKVYGLIVAGSGVITKKGIIIVKISEHISKLAKEKDDIKEMYSSGIKRELHNQNLKGIKDIDGTKEFEQTKSLVIAHKKALKSLTSETAGMSYKTIRRTHRFNVRRRR